MQVPVGLALDILGVRRAVIVLSGFAILGGAICTFAPDMTSLFLGQLLIGAGCAPAFVAAIVFTSKHWPVARFAGISGFVLAIGSGGMLLSATPLAWVVDRWSWRSAFAVLTVMSALTLLASALVLESLQCNAREGLWPRFGKASTDFALSCLGAGRLRSSRLVS